MAGVLATGCGDDGSDGAEGAEGAGGEEDPNANADTSMP
ncbi:MAG: HNH endonuclease, partial [Deltaproteobacteria bacterium]